MENFEAMPRVRVKAHAKTSKDKVGDLIERTNFVSGANFARSHLQKIWDWMYSLYNVLETAHTFQKDCTVYNFGDSVDI